MSQPAPAPRYTLRVLPDLLAIVRLDPSQPLPAWATVSAGLTSVTRTARELSIVCPISAIPAAVPRDQRQWRAFEFTEDLDFALVGVLAAIAAPLAAAGISIFAISTHDTDYVLVEDDQLAAAITALRAQPHLFEISTGDVGAG